MLKRKNEEDPSNGHTDPSDMKRAAMDVEVTTESVETTPSADEAMDDGSPTSQGSNSRKDEEAHVATRTEKIQQQILKMQESNKDQETNTYIHLRMLCQVKEAAVIVGRNGETINRIKSKANVKIKVSENIYGVMERVIHFKGRAAEVAKAFSLIAKLLADEPEDKEATDRKSKRVNITLLVPHQMIGFIIGKRGMTLRGIERVSSAYLQASINTLPYSTDRTLNIAGLFDAIYIAIYQIAIILVGNKEEHGESTIVFYQPGSQTLQAFEQHLSQIVAPMPPIDYIHGCLPVSNLAPIKFQQPPSHSHSEKFSQNTSQSPSPKSSQKSSQKSSPNMKPATSSKQTPTTNLAQTPNKFQFDPNAKLHVPTGPPQFTHVYQQIPPPMLIPYPVPVLSMPVMFGPKPQDSEKILLTLHPLIRLGKAHPNKQELYIPEEFVGSVIGKNGKFIKHINLVSLCQMVVCDREKPDAEGKFPEERMVTLTGHTPGREIALRLISKKIEDDIKSRDLKLKNRNPDASVSESSSSVAVGNVKKAGAAVESTDSSDVKTEGPITPVADTDTDTDTDTANTNDIAPAANTAKDEDDIKQAELSRQFEKKTSIDEGKPASSSS
ncbi:hypothetical protein WICPIJ_005788, partial [Wickerhamomyces pijperi]